MSGAASAELSVSLGHTQIHQGNILQRYYTRKGREKYWNGSTHQHAPINPHKLGVSARVGGTASTFTATTSNSANGPVASM